MSIDSVQQTLVRIVWVIWVFGIGLTGIPYLIATRSPDQLSLRGGFFRLLGVPLIFLGSTFLLWASRGLTAPGGTPVHTHGPTDLITGGPYRYSRHPIYVSALGIILGEAILLSHLGLVAYAGLAWGYIRVLIGYEEKTLREEYGDAYEDYCESVPRWIGLAMTPSR